MFDVIFILGQGSVKNGYVIYSGSDKECNDYIANLPSECDEGWQDAAAGTNPYQEGCVIESRCDT